MNTVQIAAAHRPFHGGYPDGTRCQVPGCEMLTNTGICGACDRWVDEQVGELERDAQVEKIAARFRAAVAALPWVADKLARGQQFNAYESGRNGEDDADEDREMYLGIGPVSDFRFLGNITGLVEAELVEAALKLATLASR